MDENNLVYRLKKRAEIRRQISSRKSVQEGNPDRISDLLEEAATELTKLQTCINIQQIDTLNSLLEAYHGRNGTYNSHYSHFDLLSWRPYMKEYGLTKEECERMEVEDYAVRIAWMDNSNSYDSYTVLLKDILAWQHTSSTFFHSSTK